MHHDTEQDRLYSIGSAVAELQRSFPDVSHSSLRFLEREGLLEPFRTEGGHRKFRASDLERVRTIKEWQSQHLSLDDIRQRLAFMDKLAPPEVLWPRFLELGLAGKDHEARALILNADEAGVPLITMFQEILTPALIALGEGWAAGTVTVGQEHEVSELCRDLVSDLTSRHAGLIRGDFSVLAACVEGEMHELGLRMVFGLLRQRGVLVHFLGASVPTSFLVESVKMREPDVLLLSVAMEYHREALVRAVEAVHEALPAPQRPVIVVGGQQGGEPLDAAMRDKVLLLNQGSLQDSVEAIMAVR
jgi:DNA-binding transcriptional MerR regulator/methylmalonyl-CoA mutase cobalamin-binding subunit